MRFYDLGSDINWRQYGGRWMAREPYVGGNQYHYLEFINWQEYTGEAAADGDRYLVMATTVDPSLHTEEVKQKAVASLGDGETNPTEWRVAQALAEWGYGDEQQFYGNNAAKLLRQAKRSV